MRLNQLYYQQECGGGPGKESLPLLCIALEQTLGEMFYVDYFISSQPHFKKLIIRKVRLSKIK